MSSFKLSAKLPLTHNGKGDREVVEEIARTLKELEQISESEVQSILSEQQP